MTVIETIREASDQFESLWPPGRNGSRRSLIHEKVALVDNDHDTLCWEWTGALNSDGYAVLQRGTRTSRRQFRVHVLMYELLVVTVGNGHMLDHLCCVRKCVNPYHLEEVTSAEN